MNIVIKEAINFTIEDCINPNQSIGIKHSALINHEGHLVYQVVNKQLFMMSVIKYGIVFKKVECNSSLTDVSLFNE